MKLFIEEVRMLNSLFVKLCFLIFPFLKLACHISGSSKNILHI